MADVTVEDVVDAIVLALNLEGSAPQVIQNFAAVAGYVNDKDYTDYTTDPDVLIFPRSETNEMSTREHDRFDFSVGIAVVRKVENTSYATIKPLLALPRAIRKLLRMNDLAGCYWKNTSFEAPYGHDELKQDGVLITTIGSDYWIEQ